MSTTPARRALAPDLARGAMLLAIACAHAPLFVLAVDHGPALAHDAALAVHQLFVGNHARPLFAFLLGYALVQMLDRRTARGADPVEVRRSLRRRGWWLVVFGAVHTLLVPIDILAVYGIVSVLVVGLLRARNTTLLVVGALLLVPGTLSVGYGMWLPMSQGLTPFDAGNVGMGTGDPLGLLLQRIQAWPFALVFASVSVVPPVVFGMWAARHRILDEPERHRAFLIRTAVLTTAVSAVGALPAILVLTGAWDAPGTAALWTAALAQPFTGYFGAMGMAALVALVAIRVARGPGRMTAAVIALGRRSLTFYLVQTPVFIALFHPWGLGLYDDVGLAGSFGVAALVWLGSLVAADLMERRGHRGPAETLLRRLTARGARPAGAGGAPSGGPAEPGGTGASPGGATRDDAEGSSPGGPAETGGTGASQGGRTRSGETGSSPGA
ncbi:putative membrane protein YeiB [Nocardiopsis sp. Huas11]|uniref:DUF418 domain-containing protein n=1 Tax=Nocardiopsis sp. Huas11 TaxID=2183912 RepID=UPI000EAF946B|nr:DUF418 domain-containing protein [Nocardiopsis sp. Huas11]RKS07172.1 putative membrane protein YeiB [Nocardiopsis sp. Huas11]